jgi:hypothetical protein
MSAEELFQLRHGTPHNIDQHLMTLRSYATGCEWIAELGTECGWSTSAWLAARPRRVDCYDIKRQPEVATLEEVAAAEGIQFTFHLEDSRTCELGTPDLLFIDTDHTYDQLRAELAAHGDAARRYLIFHDTETFPEMVPALAQWAQRSPHWHLREHFRHQHGLTIYERRPL